MGERDVVRSGVHAMIADVTLGSATEERALMFGHSDAFIYAAQVLGPFVASLVCDYLSPEMACASIALFGVVNLLLIKLTYQETLHPSRVRPVRWAKANPFATAVS